MATKLVSANMGIVLIVERDGEQERHEFSLDCPRGVRQPHDMLFHLKLFMDDLFETDIDQVSVPVLKPKKIKADRHISQDEFNKRIKELQP